MSQDPNTSETEGFSIINIDLIDDPARPLRSDLTPESVADLVLSIKQLGIIEPLIVRSKNSRFEIIAGHRRFTAAQIAKLDKVPCIIKNLGSEDTEIMKLHENIYREDVRPSDEAKHFNYLIQHLKISPAKVASLVGRSGSYVSERLAIFNYPPELRQALDSKKITFSVAREFSRHPDVQKIKEFTRYAVANGCTPNMARSWVVDDVRALNQRNNPTTPGSGENSYQESESPSYKCVVCKDPIEIQELTIGYFHDNCHKQVTADTDTTPSSETIHDSENHQPLSV